MVILASCSETKYKEAYHETFSVTEVMALDTITYMDYTAEITAVQNVEIRARVSGYLEKVHIDEGQLVKKGQVLFSINDLVYTEELNKAKAQCKNALAELNAVQIELKNTKTLSEKKMISQTELELSMNRVESAQAKVEEAQANVASAYLRVSNAIIKAPFDGAVNRIPHKIGSLIEEGTLLTSISQNDEVFAYFNVSEKEYLNYASAIHSYTGKANTVTLILANGREHVVKGQIETMEGEIDRKTGNIAFRARFKNKDGLLKHGASGKIRLTNTYNDALVIPQKATFEIQDKMYVYVLDKDNTVKAQRVTSIGRIPHLYIIGSGLTTSDKIVCEGIQNMKDGLEINPEFISMKKILQQLYSQNNR
jgi:membrane fusion protein (multidrug efflux system)